jgi:hypothetical protein
MSAPPGGDIGGELSVVGILGNEKSSFSVGSLGATARGELFPSAKKPGGEPATGGIGAVPGVPGTSAIEPASDAAIAFRSDSVKGPGGVDGAEAGTLGADSNNDVRCTGSISSVNITVGISSDSTSGAEAYSSTPSPFARSLGIARKNSFASLSSVAGSGKGIVPNG